MKKYENPEMEIQMFEVADVITTSAGDPNKTPETPED